MSPEATIGPVLWNRLRVLVAGISLAFCSLFIGACSDDDEESAEESAEPVDDSGGDEVILHTSMGDITFELLEEASPIACKNFRSYAEEGFYDETIFHRVIPGFGIQAGGYTPLLVQKPTKSPIKNESKNFIPNKKGTIAVVRRKHKDSGTSQFLINLKDNFHLDYRDESNYGYTVFGRIKSGLDVAEAISKVDAECPSQKRRPCTVLPAGMLDVPKEPVVIKSIEFP